MTAAESRFRGWLVSGVSLLLRAYRPRKPLPEGPQYVMQHLRRLHRHDAGIGTRSDASREALLRDVDGLAETLRPGE